MLSVEDLHVSYGRIAAVRGVSFHVAEQEAVALIGPNGAGKTTILKAISGLLPVLAGEVSYRGSSLLGERPEAIVRMGISLVPEGRRIFSSLTVEENMRLGATPSKVPVEEAIEREVGRFPVLRRKLSTVAGKLSGGEQQQLAIARALLAEPRLLLLDEPSLGLSPQLVQLVFETLESLREEGRTILLVEQVAARSIAFADRTLVLRQGEVVLQGTRYELSHSEKIVQAYMGL